jgi:hypothetical protein
MVEESSRAHASWQRVAALLLLFVLGIASLPLSALVLGDEGTENWILPAAAALVLLVGAAVGSVLPGLAGAGASRRRAAGVGAVAGVGMLVVGVVLFFLLLNGFSGA